MHSDPASSIKANSDPICISSNQLNNAPSKSYTSTLFNLADTFTNSVSTLSFPPLIYAARMAVIAIMSRSIGSGSLRVLTANGVFVFPSDAKRKELGLGEAKDGETVDIRVIRDTFWLRLATLGDMGFAEAYMAGDCEVSDLVKVFKVCRKR